MVDHSFLLKRWKFVDFLLIFGIGLGLLHQEVSGNKELKSLFSKASCEFAVDILKSQSEAKEGNVVLSPSSIGILLAILQQGAKENSLQQLQNVLHMSPEESKNGHQSVLKSLQREKQNVTLEWGTKAYIRPLFEIDDNYNSTIREYFQADIEELNFVEPSPEAAAAVINDWVKEITKNNIKDLVPSSLLKPETVLIMLNAVFFKGLWDSPFKRTVTKQDIFETSPDNPVEVSFMSQKDRFLAGEDPESGIQWVDLPFKDEQFSMLFILPIEKHGLGNVLGNMTGTLLQKVISDEGTRQVTIHLPKFKLKEKIFLAEALEKLGLKDIFTSEANLQGVTPHFKNLVVSQMIHEASLEIDEDGGTASAATFFTLELSSAPLSSDPLLFKADHPFLFFLLDRTNQIPLFAGKVINPS